MTSGQLIMNFSKNIMMSPFENCSTHDTKPGSGQSKRLNNYKIVALNMWKNSQVKNSDSWGKGVELKGQYMLTLQTLKYQKVCFSLID